MFIAKANSKEHGDAEPQMDQQGNGNRKRWATYNCYGIKSYEKMTIASFFFTFKV